MYVLFLENTLLERPARRVRIMEWIDWWLVTYISKEKLAEVANNEK